MRVLLVIAGLLLLLAAVIYLAATHVLTSDYARTALEEQLTTRVGQPVHIGGLSAAVFPRVAVDLDNVTVGAPATVTLAHVRLVAGLRALLSRTISDAEVIVRDSRVTLPLRLGLAPAAHQAGTAPAGLGLAVESVRVIALKNVELMASGHVMRIDLRGSLTGDRLDVEHVSLRGKSSRIDGKGTLSSLAPVEGAIEATADPLDLDELMALASAATSATSDGPQPVGAAPMHLTMNLRATKGEFTTYTFSDLSTTVALSTGTVTLMPLAVQAFGGQFNGRLDVDTRRSAPELRLNGRLDRLDIAPLMKANGISGGITGTLGGTVNLSASGTDAGRVVETARGSIAAAIINGTIEHLDLVRTIVLAFGKPSGGPAQGSGSAFTHLGGTFALANRTLTSNDLSLASRDFDVAGRCTLRLSTGALDARGDVVLSRELTAQAGTDLRRYAQEDGRIVVPATVTGTITEPQVFVDVEAATKRAIQNELQRRAKSLLEGLFKKKKE